MHAIANTPAKLLGVYIALFPSNISLPQIHGWVGLRITVFGACSAFTHVMACILAKSPEVTLYTEGFSRLVTYSAPSIATGWSDSCRAGFVPAGKAVPFHGARGTSASDSRLNSMPFFPWSLRCS